MPGFNILVDHVYYYEPKIEKRPPLDGLNLSLFRDITMSWSKFGSYMEAKERIFMTKSHDYDGTPYEDFYSYVFDANDSFDKKSGISMSVTFNSVYDDTEFDYISTVQKSNNTAYKYRSPGPPQETRFRVYEARIRMDSGDPEIWFRSEISRIKDIFDYLEVATSSLNTWVEHGLSMRVFCAGWQCYKRDDITSDRLSIYAERGWSLDEFQKKLKCSVCGSRPSKLVPVPRLR